MRIDSTANPRIKALVRLQRRRDQDRILIEGVREVMRALAAGHPLHEVYFCDAWVTDTQRHELETLLAGRDVAVFELGHQAFEKASYRQSPDGVLAVGGPFTRQLDKLALSDSPLLLVADQIEKPGNLGAMLRSVSGVGADALISCDGVTDLGNPNVIRASMGAVFEVPCVAASYADTIAYLQDHTFQVVAADPMASETYWDVDLSGRVALVIGAEAQGLPKAWCDVATQLVSIPMHGQADSLNAATAATLLLYEAARQRR